jgi:hypothetical protein
MEKFPMSSKLTNYSPLLEYLFNLGRQTRYYGANATSFLAMRSHLHKKKAPEAIRG